MRPGRCQPLPLPPTIRSAGAQRFDTGRDIQGKWWRLLHSAPLDALVTQALKASPTLTAAQAALRQARENVHVQRGQCFPTVTAGLSASRNLTPVASLSPASASGNPDYSLITPELNVSFVPDVTSPIRCVRYRPTPMR
jgi:outer membrane protein TolC